MGKLRKISKKLPVLPFAYRFLRNKYVSYKLSSKTTAEVFTDIYRKNVWDGQNSISGTGSELCQTRKIIQRLSSLFNDFNISTMLDIPCGDFYWMKKLDLSNIDYVGVDIVKELILKNTDEYGRDGVSFQYMNLIKDKLPKKDLLFCRDCLVHFSFADIFSALDNVCNSKSEYILTTTFTDVKNNYDIATGQWRTLNLELAPFMLPKPLRIINEGCLEEDGAYDDKALGLWEIADIRKSLAKRGL